MTTPRKSSSVPIRASGSEPLVALDEGVVLAPGDAPGGEGVDPHLGCQHRRQVAGQLREATLARGVGRRVAHPGALVEAHVGPDEAVDARHVDDAAVAAGAQQRCEPAGQREGGREVEGQRHREGLVGLLLERDGIPRHAGGAGEGGVVDEHVARAELLDRLDDAREPLGVEQVGGDGEMARTPGSASTVAVHASLRRSTTTTRAPAVASASASTAPSGPAPPVTTAVRPVRSVRLARRHEGSRSIQGSRMMPATMSASMRRNS